MARPAPSLLDLDILRATLGDAVVAPYTGALGAAPWLTAGTLTWPVADAWQVLRTWRGWTELLPATALTAVRVGERTVAVDVAFVGDPWGAPARLAPLRALAPRHDTVGIASPAALLGRRGGAPARLMAVTAPLAALPDMAALAAAQAPEGVSVGARHGADDAAGLIALGIEADARRVCAALVALSRTMRVTA